MNDFNIQTKTTLKIDSYMDVDIERAVKMLNEGDLDEIVIPNCSGMRLVRPETAAGRRRLAIPAMIIKIHSSGGKKYYVSQS
jgi:hypothetical protein